jgi:hypothetical protein
MIKWPRGRPRKAQIAEKSDSDEDEDSEESESDFEEAPLKRRRFATEARVLV